MASLYKTATEYVANEITISRGTVEGVTGVGVYHTTNAEEIPAVASFTSVYLADGTSDPPDPLATVGKIEVLSLIGPKEGSDLELSIPGDYQRFVLVQTAAEDIIRRVDVLEIM